jgi:hypothetical protein
MEVAVERDELFIRIVSVFHYFIIKERNEEEALLR